MGEIKGKAAVVYAATGYVSLKYTNNLGVYAPKSLFTSSRIINKDDLYEIQAEPVKNLATKPKDLPQDAAYIAKRVKFVREARMIKGAGIITKLSSDGEYGFVKFTLDGKEIQLFCTRITVKPEIPKGGMLKLFKEGGKINFLGKEQPPSGQQNIEWRTVTACTTEYRIESEGVVERISSDMSVPRSLPPASILLRASSTVSSGFESNSSPNQQSSTVFNGTSYASRAAVVPPSLAAIIAGSARSNMESYPRNMDLPSQNCPDPRIFSLTSEEKSDALRNRLSLDSSPSFLDCWESYKRDDERSLESFEAELSQLSHVAHALYGGDYRGCLSLS